MPLIQAGATPQNLDIFTRFGGTLTDPLAITFSIVSPTGMLSPSGVAGYRRTVGHYDARDFGVIPSGLDPDPWTICWEITSPAGVTSQHKEAFSVANAIDASFTNLDNLVALVKIDMGLADTVFTDDQYELLLSKALNRLNRKLSLTGTTSELSINQTDGSIQPTPDASMQDLIVLQAECLIAKNLRRTAIGKGIKVKDGPSSIDTTASFKGQDDVVQDFCGELDDAVDQFIRTVDGPETYGALITYENSNVYVEMDHNGDGDGSIRDKRSPFDSRGGFGTRGNC